MSKNNKKLKPKLFETLSQIVMFCNVHSTYVENIYVYTFFFIFRVADLLDYTADEITGMNLYTLCHGEDANKLRKSHVDCKYQENSCMI